MEVIDRNLVIHVDNEVDHLVAEQIREEFEKVCAKQNVKNVIFDMSKVEFMDSSGVGMIIGRYMKVKYSGGKVSVAGVSDGIDRILRMSGVYKIISKYDSVRDALMQS